MSRVRVVLCCGRCTYFLAFERSELEIKQAPMVIHKWCHVTGSTYNYKAICINSL